MRYHLLLFFFLLVSITQCQKPKDIVFKEVKNFKLAKPADGYINSTMDIIMYNPNSLGVKLSESYFDLYLNDQLVGNSVQASIIDIPRNADFAIPVLVKIESKKLDLLSNAMDVLMGKKMKLKMIGYCKVKKMGIFVKIPIEHEQEEKLQLF